jgi:putative Holliday junction resolvase
MTMTEGKVLALDWGEVRVGWALSDVTQTLAGRHDVYHREDHDADLQFLKHFVEDEGVVTVVIGIPYNMDGSIGPQAETTLEAKDALSEHLHVPIDDIDERLTSAEAERVMLEAGMSRKRRKANRDGLAAVIILQTYLAKKR